ncbi:MAG: hypothetical protein J6R45_04415, partial [Clostridia bacterium]|nr:hypothetical protein [Clostridia bacterium]
KMHMHVAKTGKNNTIIEFGNNFRKRGQSTLERKGLLGMRFGTYDFVLTQYGHFVPLISQKHRFYGTCLFQEIISQQYLNCQYDISNKSYKPLLEMS